MKEDGRERFSGVSQFASGPPSLGIRRGRRPPRTGFGAFGGFGAGTAGLPPRAGFGVGEVTDFRGVGGFTDFTGFAGTVGFALDFGGVVFAAPGRPPRAAPGLAVRDVSGFAALLAAWTTFFLSLTTACFSRAKGFAGDFFGLRAEGDAFDRLAAASERDLGFAFALLPAFFFFGSSLGRVGRATRAGFFALFLAVAEEPTDFFPFAVGISDLPPLAERWQSPKKDGAIYQPILL